MIRITLMAKTPLRQYNTTLVVIKWEQVLVEETKSKRWHFFFSRYFFEQSVMIEAVNCTESVQSNFFIIKQEWRVELKIHCLEESENFPLQPSPYLTPTFRYSY